MVHTVTLVVNLEEETEQRLNFCFWQSGGDPDQNPNDELGKPSLLRTYLSGRHGGTP